MQVTATALPEVLELIPKRVADARGYFSETWNSKSLAQVGIDLSFCQDNESFSARKGTLRGLHIQAPPNAQDKLVRVVAGAILDVAVDIRESSANYGKWVGVELSAAKGNQIFVPQGFLHGFVTLTPDTHVIYKCSAFYAPQSELSVRWDDPVLGIDWGVQTDQIILSRKDEQALSVSELGALLKCGAVA
ncbi:dTDP-4-dehydrorhamnose 3,5-epimerase [Litoreibacter janthinus]|uniref:dTDP-4-dehydrorhamnose 3,5-epimerase n=1 Tax=Litoreibacter janthinus TaxID=670154 RepID=A0A1I6ICP8_9RHOB|nr:dTDP-4-dehydrorhamnose 3,5-epimerase [Litoreibacter janthinus]SFR64478.1 dTDP-4-dehydrorhamnose 3,5-epimerase [Litoreibacter janthinus]